MTPWLKSLEIPGLGGYPLDLLPCGMFFFTLWLILSAVILPTCCLHFLFLIHHATYKFDIRVWDYSLISVSVFRYVYRYGSWYFVQDCYYSPCNSCFGSYLASICRYSTYAYYTDSRLALHIRMFRYHLNCVQLSPHFIFEKLFTCSRTP